MNDDTVYSDDPVAVAQHWMDAGARRLHVVDLDGATKGRPVNRDIVANIVSVCGDVPVQIGGGIRDDETVQSYLDIGVSFCIIGTKAVTTPHFVEDLCLNFPGHIIVGLDAKDGKVAIDGWSKLSKHDVIDMAQHFEQDGVSSIVYTDISRDGMMSGVNIEATVNLARAINIPVIASGGITNLEDVEGLCKVADEGIIGAITGRALYEKTLDFAQGQQLADKLCPPSAS